MTLEELPDELKSALAELAAHYGQYECHPGGANGYIVFAQNKISGANVAVKFYYGAPGDKRHDEPRLLASINSPNVLRIIDARNLSDEWAFFLTPRCFDGDLDARIATKPSVIQAIDIALGICIGASAIHSKGLIHRDLKPANIVCEADVPLIADFGSVRQLDEGEDEISASGHSALYRPPESFKSGRYSALGDIYQIGLVTYQLLGGNLPYDGFAYFNNTNRKKYAELSDPFAQSKYLDSVICDRAASAKLMNMASLPPWVRLNTRNALHAMTHPNLNQRLASFAEVAAALTRARATATDWRWVDDVARLERDGRVYELRPIASDLYEPMQSKGGHFRRIPSVANGPLKRLVESIN